MKKKKNEKKRVSHGVFDKTAKRAICLEHLFKEYEHTVSVQGHRKFTDIKLNIVLSIMEI